MPVGIICTIFFKNYLNESFKKSVNYFLEVFCEQILEDYQDDFQIKISVWMSVGIIGRNNAESTEKIYNAANFEDILNDIFEDIPSTWSLPDFLEECLKYFLKKFLEFSNKISRSVCVTISMDFFEEFSGRNSKWNFITFLKEFMDFVEKYYKKFKKRLKISLLKIFLNNS